MYLIVKFRDATAELVKLNAAVNVTEKPGNKQLKEWVELVSLLPDLPFEMELDAHFIDELVAVFDQPLQRNNFPTAAEISNRKLVLKCLLNVRDLTVGQIKTVFDKVQELRDGPGVNLDFSDKKTSTGLVGELIKKHFDTVVKLIQEKEKRNFEEIDSDADNKMTILDNDAEIEPKNQKFPQPKNNIPFNYLIDLLKTHTLNLTDTNFSWHLLELNDHLIINLLLHEKRLRVFQNSADWLLTKMSMKRINLKNENFGKLIIKCCTVRLKIKKPPTSIWSFLRFVE